VAPMKRWENYLKIKKKTKSETQNLGTIAKDFMIDKFNCRSSNSNQWMKILKHLMLYYSVRVVQLHANEIHSGARVGHMGGKCL